MKLIAVLIALPIDIVCTKFSKVLIYKTQVTHRRTFEMSFLNFPKMVLTWFLHQTFSVYNLQYLCIYFSQFAIYFAPNCCHQRCRGKSAICPTVCLAFYVCGYNRTLIGNPCWKSNPMALWSQ